jgi:2-polyprenyl-3-methyl-5-hydroxy-6-metoxy-1,4-benzoquinol methylase
MATALLRAGVRPEEITVALGPRTESATLPKDVRTVRPGSALADYIAASELVCTSFGMTALEAAAAGAGVLLLNPTRYHRALSRKLGFPDVGVRRPRKRRLRRYLRSPEWLRRQAAGAIPRRQRDLGEFLSSLDLRETGACPVCRTTGNRALARFSDRSFFRCRECGMLYRVNLSPEKISYDADYFFAEYRNQYGKTYLEDFAHIKSMGERRLDLIDSLGESLRRRPEGDARTLLDVGCAYGPFLQAAQERGYRAYGIDVADSAVEYVGNTLGIPARVARLERFDPEQAFGRPRFDVVSLWYVIEHIEELKHALEVLNRLLVPGGVLAFSTPNGRGISGRRNKTRFLEQSPADHVTVWDPPQAKRILARFGFVAERVRVTGHHPERFPGVPASALRGAAGPLARGLAAGAGAISRLFGLGDTFEIYARKAEAIA